MSDLPTLYHSHLAVDTLRAALALPHYEYTINPAAVQQTAIGDDIHI